MAVPIQIVIDCADPARLAAFWADALGYAVQPPPTGFETWEAFLRAHDVPESEWNSASAIVDPEGVSSRIFFQQVPEDKKTKNRVHLDLNVGGDRSIPLDERKERLRGEQKRLAEIGAEVIGPVEQRGEFWIVMADPEGNEFCIQ
jgi:hypothetical protein